MTVDRGSVGSLAYVLIAVTTRNGAFPFLANGLLSDKPLRNFRNFYVLTGQ